MNEASISTPTVAEDDAFALERLERESELTFFVAGGPGGQHRNRNATGVRLRHLPSGIVVTATERRSQAANREAAFARLAERLRRRLYQAPARIATRPTAASRRERLERKQHTAQRKQARRRVTDES